MLELIVCAPYRTFTDVLAGNVFDLHEEDLAEVQRILTLVKVSGRQRPG